MKTFKIIIAAVLIICLTSAVPVFAKSKTTHKSIGKLKSKTLSMTTVKVSWKKGPVTGYKVLRSAAVDGKYSEIANTSKRSFTDSGLKSGKTYYYKVRAYRCNGVNIAFSDLSVAVAGRAK